MGRIKLKDLAKVISRYVNGIGIRISMNAVSQYRDGYRFLSNFARFADIPIISMGEDRFHPCQGLADLMGWGLREMNGKNPIPIITYPGLFLKITFSTLPTVWQLTAMSLTFFHPV